MPHQQRDPVAERGRAREVVPASLIASSWAAMRVSSAARRSARSVRVTTPRMLGESASSPDPAGVSPGRSQSQRDAPRAAQVTTPRPEGRGQRRATGDECRRARQRRDRLQLAARGRPLEATVPPGPIEVAGVEIAPVGQQARSGRARRCARSSSDRSPAAPSTTVTAAPIEPWRAQPVPPRPRPGHRAGRGRPRRRRGEEDDVERGDAERRQGGGERPRRASRPSTGSSKCTARS